VKPRLWRYYKIQLTNTTDKMGFRRQLKILWLCSSNSLEFHPTLYQAITIYWLLQTSSQNSFIYPPRLVHFPTQLHCSASDSSMLEFVRYTNFVLIIIIIIDTFNQALQDHKSPQLLLMLVVPVMANLSWPECQVTHLQTVNHSNGNHALCRASTVLEPSALP